MMNGIKYIFFDLGSTLLDEDQVWKERIEKTIEGTNVSYDKFMQDVLVGLFNGQNSYTYSLKMNPTTNRTSWNPDLECLYDDTTEALTILQNDYKLGIISNQPPLLDLKLKKLGIKNFFSIAIGSEDVQLFKPDTRIFEYGIKLGGVNPEECIMVGDRIDNDILPAKKVGMKTIWIRRGLTNDAMFDVFKNEPDYVIGNLFDLVRVLKNTD